MVRSQRPELRELRDRECGMHRGEVREGEGVRVGLGVEGFSVSGPEKAALLVLERRKQNSGNFTTKRLLSPRMPPFLVISACMPRPSALMATAHSFRAASHAKGSWCCVAMLVSSGLLNYYLAYLAFVLPAEDYTHYKKENTIRWGG